MVSEVEVDELESVLASEACVLSRLKKIRQITRCNWALEHTFVVL